jgi:peptide/nickel transport system permease protein
MSDGTSTTPAIPSLTSTRRARRKLTIFGAIGIALLVVNLGCALFGSFLAPHPPGDITPGGAFAPPSATALLGNDYLSRDLFSRLLDGARFSLGVAGLATCLGFLAGMSIGFSAAEIRGRLDAAVTWAIDVLLSFPPILLALIVIAGLGTSLPVLIGTIAFIQSPRVARVSRAVALGIATLEFVEAARARGEGLAAILIREIFPSTVRPLAVEFGLRLSYAVLFMSSLSFLGLGIQPPDADWGGMVRENLPGLYYGALASIVPGIMIGLLVLGINLTVDWLSAGADAQIAEELR